MQKFIDQSTKNQHRAIRKMEKEAVQQEIDYKLLVLGKETQIKRKLISHFSKEFEDKSDKLNKTGKKALINLHRRATLKLNYIQDYNLEVDEDVRILQNNQINSNIKKLHQNNIKRMDVIDCDKDNQMAKSSLLKFKQ
jgi:hypothetical protein